MPYEAKGIQDVNSDVISPIYISVCSEILIYIYIYDMLIFEWESIFRRYIPIVGMTVLF